MFKDLAQQKPKKVIVAAQVDADQAEQIKARASQLGWSKSKWIAEVIAKELDWRQAREERR